MSMNIREFQKRLLARKVTTFPHPASTYNPTSRALNVAEEAGELAREERLAIDGHPFREAKAKDAVGDTFIALVGYCIARGWELDDIVTEVWADLDERWAKGQLVGEPTEPEIEYMHQRFGPQIPGTCK